MKTEFFIQLAETDADGVFFGDKAIRDAADQIKELPVNYESEKKGITGIVKETEVVNSGAIRVTAEFNDGSDLPVNRIGTIGYMMRDFEKHGNDMEITSFAVYNVFLNDATAGFSKT